MTDTTLINDIDQHIVEFQTLHADAHQLPLPEYNVDWRGDLHPWITELRDVEANLLMTLTEQIRPRLTGARAAGTDEAPFHQRYETLLRLVRRLEAITERCRRGAPWMAVDEAGKHEGSIEILSTEIYQS
jgi:hypothetical protein